MNIILYITLFVIGTLFGSFYTLAVYRIPKGIDIVKTHSFCPYCHHKLGFWELIPVWSYIALGGKCKQCKRKIRPRYFMLEILSGATLVLMALSLKITVETLTIGTVIGLACIILYMVAIFLIAGIDKEYQEINKSVLYYAIGISVIYIIYLCIIDKASIYRYVMYLSILLILLAIDTIILTKKAKNSYLIGILMLIMIMTIFTREAITVLTIIMTLLCITFSILIQKVKYANDKVKIEDKQIAKELRMGFYLCTSNIIMLILTMFVVN